MISVSREMVTTCEVNLYSFLNAIAVDTPIAIPINPALIANSP